MIERRAFNPVDMILQFRRVVDYLSKLPATLNVAQVARYVAAEAMMNILEVDMIVVFLSEPNAPHLVKKYTIRSEKGELIDLNDLKPSISSQSFTVGNTTSTNNIASTNGNNNVGGSNATTSSSAHTATCMYSEMMACKPVPRSIKTAKILSATNASIAGNGGTGTGTATSVSVNSATVFNHTVDGTPGVVARNAMMVPLKGSTFVT